MWEGVGNRSIIHNYEESSTFNRGNKKLIFRIDGKVPSSSDFLNMNHRN